MKPQLVQTSLSASVKKIWGSTFTNAPPVDLGHCSILVRQISQHELSLFLTLQEQKSFFGSDFYENVTWSASVKTHKIKKK